MNPRRQAVLTILLRLRRQKANAARSSLVAAQAETTAARKHNDLLNASMAHCNAVAGRAARQPHRAGETGICRTRMAGIRRELSSCRARVNAAEETLAAGRAVLAEAIRHRRALDRARRRAATTELSARAGRAQKELEELHAAHTARGRQGRGRGQKVEIVETV